MGARECDVAQHTLHQLALRGLEPSGSTPEQFAAQIQKDIDRLTSLVKQLGIKPQ